MEQWFALFIIEHSSQQEVCRFESWFLCGVCVSVHTSVVFWGYSRFFLPQYRDMQIGVRFIGDSNDSRCEWES